MISCFSSTSCKDSQLSSIVTLSTSVPARRELTRRSEVSRGLHIPRFPDQLLTYGNTVDSFDHFITSPCCKYVLFAGCHDNGYARLLEKHPSDKVKMQVGLVKAAQRARDYDELQPILKMHRLNSFRAYPLKPPTSTPAPPPTRSPHASQLYSAKAGQAVAKQEADKAGATEPSPASRLTSAELAASTNPVVAQAIRNRKMTEQILGSIERDPKSGLRTDKALDRMPFPQAAAFKDRICQQKLCNEFQVKGDQGHCFDPMRCGYSHETLTLDEKRELLLVLRKHACRVGQMNCTDPLCWYSHRDQ